jgi:protease PrsW
LSRVRTVVVTEIFLVLGLLAFVAVVYAIERSLDLDQAVRLSPLAALTMSAVPALLWLAYFYLQDRHEPEPTHYVLGIYVLGCLVAGPVASFLTVQLTGPAPLVARSVGALGPESLVRTFLIVALAQELCKYVVVRYTVYRSPEFDEPMDGIVYMTAAATGVATWENYQDLQHLEGNVFLTLGAAHTVVVTLAHACFAGVTGYALGWAKFTAASSNRRAVVLLLGLLIAAALNGQFRLLESLVTAADMEVRPWRGLAFAAGFAAAIFFITSLLMRRLLAISPHRIEAPLTVPAAAEAPTDTQRP